ncbi:MAG TPA: ribosomal protein S18-alanine N-acetyltransferase, partial [Dissulfurispiraceae bacterium]|nr:ribosomal protein S18-alanine N-acetyltransferase [Dissulfurispiraceae bacterium]
RNHNSLSLLAEIDNQVVGYIVVRIVADEAHLHDIAVHPAQRRRGIARSLMDRVLDELRTGGTRFFFLEVRKSNEAAHLFYSSFGFRAYALRRGYYASPEEDACLMRVDFSPIRSN